jgi:lysophospholipase L1-like esterase
MAAPSIPPSPYGIDQTARAGVALRPRLILNSFRSGVLEVVGASAAYVNLVNCPIPGGTITPGCELNFQAQLAKYAPNNAGWSWRAGFRQGANTVLIAQNAIGAAVHSAFVRTSVFMATDLKSAVNMDVNTLGLASLAAAYTSDTGAANSDRALMGARQPGNIMFVSYSAPPTVETTLIDFSQPCTFVVEITAQNGDKIELVGASLEMQPVVGFTLNSKTVYVYGDSLTEGTGSGAVSGAAMDVTSQLRRLRSGWPMQARGLGGQTTATLTDGIHIGQQITERLISDAASKYAKVILWAGTNDFDAHAGDGPGWFAAMKIGIDRVIAYRGGTADLMLSTLHPRAGWAVGDANYTALQYVNAQMIATYGSIVCDLFTALATASGLVPLSRYSGNNTTGSITSGANALIVASATGIAVGQYVISPGSTAINDGSTGIAPTVTAVSGTTITLSANASATLSSAPVSFIGVGEVHLSNAGYAIDAQVFDAKMTALGWA